MFKNLKCKYQNAKLLKDSLTGKVGRNMLSSKNSSTDGFFDDYFRRKSLLAADLNRAPLFGLITPVLAALSIAL